MAVCRVYQIPHSQFLGGPARWTDLDQDKAIAYEQYLKQRCRCGTRLEEWEQDPYAYLGYHWRCPGCEVLEQEQDNVPDGEKGVHVGLLPRAVVEAEEDREQAEREARRANEEGG